MVNIKHKHIKTKAIKRKTMRYPLSRSGFHENKLGTFERECERTHTFKWKFAVYFRMINGLWSGDK